jgi:tetratricopeptide (TPR) repeat protein
MNKIVQKKVTRNDACPCNSGKKFKHCCAENGLAEQNPHTDVNSLIALARHNAFQLGNFGAAEQAYRQVLELKPNNIEALAGVGQGLCWRHRRAEGRQFLAKAGKLMLRNLDKTEVNILLELAEQLQMWGEIDLALQLSRGAVKKAPTNPAALFGVASCLHRLNHSDLAISALQTLLKILPNDAGCQILMALLEIDKKQFSQAEQRLEHVLKVEQDNKQLARACLELAKVYDKQKRYSEAFALINKAGQLHSQLPEAVKVDAEFIFAKINTYKNGYDVNLLKRWTTADFADNLPAPVFLIGFLRSGTTLTEQVLSAHPNTITSDENYLLDEVIAQLAQITGIKTNIPDALRQIDINQAKQLRQFYWQRVSEEFTPAALKKCFINKVALNSIEAGFISALFPDAKIIFALRDPRDVCLSCATQSFTTSVATINLLSWQGIAKQYAAVMDLWLSLRDNISATYIELRYEDTVTDFENSFRRVFALLGLDWHPQISHFHEKLTGKYVATPSFSAVAQPLYQTSLARWHGYEDFYKPILPMLQPFIEAFGYI